MSPPSTRSSAPRHRADAAQRHLSPRAVLTPSSRKHAAERPARELRTRLRRSVVVPGIAVAALGVGGLVGAATSDQEEKTAALLAQVNSDAIPSTGDSEVLDDMRAERTLSTSRSDRRTDVDSAKLEALSQETESGGQLTRTEDLGGGDPRMIAQAMLPEFGFSADQFSCLDALWTKESGWDVYADNPTSSAYGIPQSLPGEKMASAGADWATNPATQIRWGLGYIRDRYGSPCSAWSFKQGRGWY